MAAPLPSFLHRHTNTHIPFQAIIYLYLLCFQSVSEAAELEKKGGEGACDKRGTPGRQAEEEVRVRMQKEWDGMGGLGAPSQCQGRSPRRPSQASVPPPPSLNKSRVSFLSEPPFPVTTDKHPSPDSTQSPDHK